MLKMKPSCECCDIDLPPDSQEAMICSFECTFCKPCVTNVLEGICPNCGGNFVPRPKRVGENLVRYPASSKRVLNKAGCRDLV